MSEPLVFINDQDAAGLGIENGDQVKLVSDVGECLIQAKLTRVYVKFVGKSRPTLRILADLTVRGTVR